MELAMRMAMACHAMRDFPQARRLQTPWVGFRRHASTSCSEFRLRKVRRFSARYFFQKIWTAQNFGFFCSALIPKSALETYNLMDQAHDMGLSEHL